MPGAELPVAPRSNIRPGLRLRETSSGPPCRQKKPSARITGSGPPKAAVADSDRLSALTPHLRKGEGNLNRELRLFPKANRIFTFPRANAARRDRPTRGRLTHK